MLVGKREMLDCKMDSSESMTGLLVSMPATLVNNLDLWESMKDLLANTTD